MSFIPATSHQRVVPGWGDKASKICIIGEAPGAEEDRLLRPFAGPAGTVLDQCLHAAGITRNECYLTNVVKVRPRNNDISPYFNSRTGGFTAPGSDWVAALREELSGVKSNVLVPLGATAMAALTGQKSISKLRGYVTPTLPSFGGRKCLPAYHPAASLRGQYILRYYITADLRKAKAEAAYPDLRRPERKLAIPESLSECLEWLAYLGKQPRLSIDIEVVNFEVSCIGFAPSPQLAVSIPMYHEHWDEAEETSIWRAINAVLTNPNITKVFQNGIFDIHFLAVRNGIQVVGPINDTMIAHSIMYPEMLKGLGFLVSMYCGSQEYYKDMVKWDNIKEEA